MSCQNDGLLEPDPTLRRPARAVIFDLDGTLVDSLADIGESMNEVLETLGHRPHPIAAYRRFVGEGVAMLARRALPENARDDASVDICVAAMREVYGARWDRLTRPYPGIEDLLLRLTADGIALAVLSNKLDDLTRLVVDGLLPRTRFDAVVGARPGVPRKPDPTAARAIARTLGVAAADVAYVGDTATDMHTATAAGMFAIGAVWGFHDADELVAAGAGALAHRPPDVHAALAPQCVDPQT